MFGFQHIIYLETYHTPFWVTKLQTEIAGYPEEVCVL